MATATQTARAATRGRHDDVARASLSVVTAAPESIAGAEGVVGFRLFIVEDLPYDLPEAIGVSLPVPDLGRERS